MSSGAATTTIFEEGQRAWPRLAVNASELDQFLSGREPTEPPPAADLFLVCACVLGRPEAMASLESSVLALVPGWVAKVDSSPDFGDDVAQAVRELLLTGERPRLGTYAGKGSLEGWVRVTAVRIALKLKGKKPSAATVELASSAGATPDLGTQVEKAQVRAEVEQAMELVLAALDTEERAWLKLYYLDGLSLEKVASLFGVHTSTISRRIAALESHVLAALRDRLQHQLRLPRAEVESLIRFVRSQLEVSLGRALKKTID
jgi:RNA polymerase sigma-70 factor (ECF subfamily)